MKVIPHIVYDAMAKAQRKGVRKGQTMIYFYHRATVEVNKVGKSLVAKYRGRTYRIKPREQFKLNPRTVRP